MKRTLLAGAAAAALLFGIYAGSSRFLDGLFADTRTAEAAQEHLAPAPENFVPPVPTPAVMDSRTTPDTTTAAEPVATAAHVPPMAFEPTMTGSIPKAETAAPEPLPMEIGGPKLRTRAIAGDAAAQYEVGMRFAEGRGVARDPEKAVLWMARAAEQGLPPAQYRFANLTEKGIGTAKDIGAARSMYEQAAAAGNVQAMHNLGVIYAEGGLGQPDMAVASVWFRKAAEYGVKDSQYNLAILYARGISVSQDLAESFLWFSLAAKQGDKDAESKRDQVGAKLDAGKAAELRVRADTWKPKTAPAEANEVAPPPGGWDESGKPA
jgi:localization factor PodJL